MARFSQLTIVTLLSWFVASSLWNYPHSLAYFNESIGGPLNGPKHLLGSNVDWGQDLRMLANWIRLHDDHGSIFVSCVARPNLAVDKSHPPVPPPARAGESTETYLQRVRPGRFVFSAQQLFQPRDHVSHRNPAAAGNSQLVYPYQAFHNRPPDERLGYSIMVYCLE